jgi:hypothetical protein
VNAKADHNELERVLAIFQQRDESGALTYSDDDVAHVLPLMVLAAIGEDDVVPKALAPIVEELLQNADITADLDDAEAQVRLDAYIALRPPPARLVKELQALFDGHSEKAHAKNAVRAARALGASSSKRPVGDAPTPAGAARGGVMARVRSATKSRS